MIYLGTSGFSYDDWKGHFYPDRLAKKDMLSYYASRFAAVEVNSTYYAIPSPRSFEGMARKTPENFEFVVKAHQDMTHVAQPAIETFQSFRDAIQPLKDARKFGCVLAQFPWAFKNTEGNVDLLREFRDRMEDLPTVVEFRNSDWITDEAFGVLRELNFGFCAVDEPHLKGLMPPICASTSSIGYVRFHGRNAQKWWKHDESHERYDYLYSEEELAEWVPKVEDLAGHTEKTYLFFNNHYQGKSAQNARMFADMLGLGLPVAPAANPARQMTLGDGF